MLVHDLLRHPETKASSRNGASPNLFAMGGYSLDVRPRAASPDERQFPVTDRNTLWLDG
jgi:hypothetical protein